MMMNADNDSKRRCVVDWDAEGSKVDWSDEEMKPERPKKKRAKPKPRRIVIASRETVGTAVLAAKRTFETVFFVSVVDKMGDLAGGATEVGERQLEIYDVKFLCERLWHVAKDAAMKLLASDSCMVVADETGGDWAKLFATLVRNILRIGGDDMAAVPKPAEKCFLVAVAAMNASKTEVSLRSAICRLSDLIRYG